MSSPERPARLLGGGCLCGAVAFEVEDAFSYALNCHCSQCRRATGSAFKPFGGIERERFRLLTGWDGVHVVGEPDGSHDLRCRACGSLLASVVRGGKWVHVTFGTLADPPSLEVQAHIMVGSKAPWFEITDDLPQHEGF